MASVFGGVLGLHILFGAAGLVLFWVPVFARKGGDLHIRAGWAYVGAMLGMVATALVLGVLAYVAPLTVHPLRPGAAIDRLDAHVATVRGFSAFFGYLALLTLTTGWYGLQALRVSRDPEALLTPVQLVLNALLVTSGLGMLGLGLWRREPLFIALSPLGVLAGGGNLAYILHPEHRLRVSWLYEHLSAMLGTGIAAHTAFLVFGAHRFFPGLFAGPLGPFLWMVPTLIGIPASILWTRFYQRTFNDYHGQTPEARERATPTESVASPEAGEDSRTDRPRGAQRLAQP